MSEPNPQVVAAEVQAKLAKERMLGSVGRLQTQLKPAVIAKKAARDLRETSGDLARTGVDVAKRNPLPIAGAVAALGLFLARGPITRLFKRKPDATGVRHQ